VTHPRIARRGPWRIFAWPLAILAASIAGLVLGLLGDGWRDAVAWLLLAGGPLAIALRLLTRTHAKETR
jgi:hypothetical protein